jgi:hypothetical protein
MKESNIGIKHSPKQKSQKEPNSTSAISAPGKPSEVVGEKDFEPGPQKSCKPQNGFSLNMVENDRNLDTHDADFEKY